MLNLALMAEDPVDEQGEPWPPAEALVAVIRCYGGDPTDLINGAVVEVGVWQPNVGFFECSLVTPVTEGGGVVYSSLDVVLCQPVELIPLNEATATYLAETVAAAVEVYDTDAYDLRDLLDSVGVAVKVESVAPWDGRQRARVRAWANALAEYQRLTGDKAVPASLPPPAEVAR